MSSKTAAFTFVDLFAGIGGFHAALSALGGECVYASEIDEAAAKIYQHNWEMARSRRHHPGDRSGREGPAA